jgi:hypothetical protein
VKGFIEKVSKLEGAATVLASILCGRFIGQVSRGFPEDPETVAQANLYCALAKLYPAGKRGPNHGCVTISKMFTRMIAKADDNSAFTDGLSLTDAEKAEWALEAGKSERDKLKDAVRPVLDLVKRENERATIDTWYDLTPLAQYSLAVRTERNLLDAEKRYASWTSEEGAGLHELAVKAKAPLAKLVGDLCASFKDELDQARASGINIATRVAANG